MPVLYPTSAVSNARRVFLVHEPAPEIRSRQTYWLRTHTDQLFICYDVIQSGELKRLMGNEIENLSFGRVLMRRKRDPFKDEIDLKRA